MEDLTQYIRDHKRELNLADISRQAGLDPSYLKKIASGKFQMSEEAEKKVRPVIERIVNGYFNLKG